MNEITKRAEIRTFVTSAVGVFAIIILASLEFAAGNYIIALVAIFLVIVAGFNAVFYRFHHNLKLANFVIGIVGAIVSLLSVIWGGYQKTGWMVMMVYVPLAFGMFKLKGGIYSILSLLISVVGLIVWGHYHGWDLGYTGIEYVIMATAYLILTIIAGVAQWEQEKTLENERENSLLITKQGEQLAKFEAAAKQSVELMVFTDPNGIVLWANEAAEKITGFTREEALNKKVGVLWGKLMPKEWYAKLWNTIKVEKKTFRAEIENHRKNGEHFFSTITIYPLLNKKGEVEFFVATQRDITHEKEVDQMKTDFISLASHQLRTPLSSMRWNLEMLINGDLGKLPLKQKNVISNIYASDKNMIALVSLLLNVSHIESGKIGAKLDNYQVKNLVKEALVDSLTKLKRRKQKIKYVLENESEEITTDKELFGQVVANLVNNAVKYSPEGSTITVKGEKAGTMYKVMVIDQGVGIPEKDKSRVFGKYYRGSNVVKIEAGGTGLGLYLCKIITKILGGEIGFESKEGEGSSFWFTVPLKNVKHDGEGKQL